MKNKSDLLEVKLSLSLQFCSPIQDLIRTSIHIWLFIERHEIYSSFISQVNKDIIDILRFFVHDSVHTSDSQVNTLLFTPGFSVYLSIFIFFSFIFILGDFWVSTHAVEKYTSCKTNIWTSWKAATDGIIFVISKQNTVSIMKFWSICISVWAWAERTKLMQQLLIYETKALISLLLTCHCRSCRVSFQTFRS